MRLASVLLAGFKDSFQEELPMWRLITEKIASLEEMETIWTYDDMLRATAVLDYKSTLTSVLQKQPPATK